MTWFTNLFKKKKIEKTIYNDDLEWDIFINFSRGKKYLLEEKQFTPDSVMFLYSGFCFRFI